MPDYANQRFPSPLKLLRKQKKIKSTQVIANELGVSKTSVDHWEQGIVEGLPRPHHLYALARFLEVTEEELVNLLNACKVARQQREQLRQQIESGEFTPPVKSEKLVKKRIPRNPGKKLGRPRKTSRTDDDNE